LDAMGDWRRTVRSTRETLVTGTRIDIPTKLEDSSAMWTEWRGLTVKLALQFRENFDDCLSCSCGCGDDVAHHGSACISASQLDGPEEGLT